MKFQRYITIAAFILAAMIPTTSQAKGATQQRVYMFGFAASFNDTIVHFTNIQAIDSVWIEGKTGFLMGRHLYATMLRNYLDKNQLPYRTSVVFFNKNLKKLQKKYIKMRKLYLGTDKKVKNHNNVKDIVDNDFRFTAISFDPSTEEEVAEETSKKKMKKSGK